MLAESVHCLVPVQLSPRPSRQLISVLMIMRQSKPALSFKIELSSFASVFSMHLLPLHLF